MGLAMRLEPQVKDLDHADKDQIEGDDVVEQPRKKQNEDARNQGSKSTNVERKGDRSRRHQSEIAHLVFLLVRCASRSRSRFFRPGPARGPSLILMPTAKKLASRAAVLGGTDTECATL